MRLRDLERLLTVLSGYQAGEIDQRMRFIRENGTVPSGPRGRNAPHVEPLHLAMGLLSMVARRATDAGPVGMLAAELQPVVSAGDTLPEYLRDTKLAALLAFALVSYPEPILDRVDIAIDGKIAWVTFSDGQRVLFLNDAKLRERVEILGTHGATGRGYMGHWLTITDTTIGVVAAAMAEAGESSRYQAGDANVAQPA